MKQKYALRCLDDNTRIEDDGYVLKNPRTKSDALLRSEYQESLKIDSNCNNVFKYSWLPVHETFECTSAPITYKSIHLAKHLGLTNLYCTFSGYAPHLGAYNTTGTFKEFEAVGVLGRHAMHHTSTLVLSSAGNTARAFAELGSNTNIPIIIVVPENRIAEVWTTKPVGNNISLYYVPDSDYTDATEIANKIASIDGYVVEGGVRNIGRRDGMATAFLSAVETMQRIPDHYFQAVGSGSGALSVWEASMRFQKHTNTAGPDAPMLHISQNLPFTPIIDSWKQGSSSLVPIDYDIAHTQIEAMYAKVLSTRHPPYSIKGGMFEALQATKGRGYTVTNTEAHSAQKLFMETEQLRLDESASITCASLLQAVQYGYVNKDDYIMFHITGGGEDTIKKDFKIQQVPPVAAIHKDARMEDIITIMRL